MMFTALTLLAGCAAPTPVSEPSPTVDIPATAQAAVDATLAVATVVQATIDSAVSGTVTAMPTPPPPPAGTPTPAPAVDYYTLTEDELNALIDQAVTDALAASEDASAATIYYVDDGTLSEEELYYLDLYYQAAEEALALAEEALYIYEDIYGELLVDTVALLTAIEEDLTDISDNLTEMTDLLAQGADAANAALDQLQQKAGETAANIQAAQEGSQNWLEVNRGEQQRLEDYLAAVQPTNVAGNRLAALADAQTYITTMREALGDQKISLAEFQNIAQLGVNAGAGLNLHGLAGAGGDFQSQILQMNGQMARGELPQLRGGLDAFERGLPRR
jgi:hypothetical protein